MQARPPHTGLGEGEASGEQQQQQHADTLGQGLECFELEMGRQFSAAFILNKYNRDVPTFFLILLYALFNGPFQSKVMAA